MLVRLVLFAVVALFGYFFLRRTLTGLSGRPTAPRPEEQVTTQLVQDPHCGVYVDRHTAVQRTVRGGRLFFCSEECAQAHLQAGKSQA